MEQTSLAAPPAEPSRAPAPSEDIVQLRAILRVVDELAGTGAQPGAEPDLALLDARHAAACGIARAGYSRLAARTARFSAAGVSALIGVSAGHQAARQAAAGYLADEMRHAIGDMTRVLG